VSTFYHPGAAARDEITSLKFSHDGALWVGTSDGLYRFDRGRFVSVLSGTGIGQIEETSNGHLLVIAGLKFVEWDGTRIVEHPELALRLGISDHDFFRVIQDHTGAMWFGTKAGVARLAGTSIHRYNPYGLSKAGALTLIEDRQRNVWAFTSGGLFRCTPNRLEPLAPSTSVRSLLADRDGNLWVGTNGDGLVRFKDRTVQMFTTADGLPNNIPMTVLARHDGSMWVGNNCGGLSWFDGRRFHTYDEKNGLINSCVWSLAEDSNHDLWIGTWGGGLFRLKEGRFTQYSIAQGLASDVVRSIAAATDGSLWIATAEGLSHMVHGRFRNYSTTDGLSSNRVGAVYQDHRGVIWVGTGRGVDRMAGDRFAPLSSAQEIFDIRYIGLGEGPFGDLYAFSAPRGISRIEGNQLVSVNSDLDLLSIVNFQRHELWFSGGNGIFRFAASGIGLSTEHGGAPLDYASVGRSDGLNSTQCSIGAPNMAITRDGKLWVATVQGLALLDLPRLRHTNRKPAIYVEEVTVGQRKAPVRHELVLPPGTQHLELKFDAIELASPEKIRFQYLLDGVDPAWLDADTTRTAVYTSIPVGAHSFHIRACNSNGVWDRDGIVFSVTQQPFFYETGLSRFLSVCLGLLIVWIIYRLRVGQITAGINARFDDRLAERTRLAREFHDTLLQTIQGSKMVADDALDEPADPVRMRRALERLSGWLAQASQEGRAALSALRTSTTQRNDLAEAFQRAGEDCLTNGSTEFSLSVEGIAKEMHPIVRDEIYRIGYEAIRNASIHSEGSKVNVKLSYGHDLSLRVRDNGKGVEPDLAATGKSGHFGLQGMRERATRIGSKFSFFSSAGSGTEIVLIVPGHIVFRDSRPIRHTRFAKIKTHFRMAHRRSSREGDR
jgi:ligand-binding sensor domain-containing protein